MDTKKKWLLVLGVLIVLLIAAGFCALVAYKLHDTRGWIKSEYQAVFLVNGQVYFGKLSHAGSWLKLTDIYYLQDPNQQVPPEQAADPLNNEQIQLVKFGSELHGPQDEMFIDRDKVMFWENLKEDSKIIETIKQQPQ